MSLYILNKMRVKQSNRVRGIAYLCMAVYFASYIMRNNFAVMIVKICSDMGEAKSSLAIILTAMTVCYGTGQVLSGVLGDKLSPSIMLTAGLSLSAICNALMFFADSIPLMTVIWGVNGFAQSMLWPPIVRILSTYLNDAEYAYASVTVSWGSSGATILMYLLCPLLLGFMSWRSIILTFAIIGASIAVVWTLVSPRFLVVAPDKLPKAPSDQPIVTETKPIPKFIILPLALMMFGIILQGVLRDGVTNWMPSLMNESFGLTEEKSILSTVLLAVFSMLVFVVASFLHTRFFKNEVFFASIIFAFSLVASILLYFANRFLGSAVISALLLSLIVAAMHGINLMLIVIVPKRFVKSGKVSTFSGILNACTYIGAALSTYGFAALAENVGWNTTILVWAAIALLGFIVCGAISPLWKRFKKEYAE